MDAGEAYRVIAANPLCSLVQSWPALRLASSDTLEHPDRVLAGIVDMIDFMLEKGSWDGSMEPLDDALDATIRSLRCALIFQWSGPNRVSVGIALHLLKRGALFRSDDAMRHLIELAWDPADTARELGILLNRGHHPQHPLWVDRWAEIKGHCDHYPPRHLVGPHDEPPYPYHRFYLSTLMCMHRMSQTSWAQAARSRSPSQGFWPHAWVTLYRMWFNRMMNKYRWRMTRLPGRRDFWRDLE